MLRVALLTLLLGTGGVMVLPTCSHADPTLPSAQVQEGTIIHVNPAVGTDNSGAGNQITAPYRTITYALKQAKAGTTIQLAPGTYSSENGEQFPVVVKPGVILQGNESTKGQNVVIRGGGAYLSRTFASQNTTFVAQQGSEIKGMTVTNPNSRGTGVWIESGNPSVHNNTFTKSLREGIFVTGNAAPKITDNVFTYNNASGISMAREAQGEIRGNVFNNTGFGLTISETSAPLVIDNQVIHNQDGIIISHSAHPTLRQNRIENNMRYGVVAIAQAQPDLGTSSSPGNNILRNNGQYDLYNLTNQETLANSGNQIGTLQRGKVELPTDSPMQELPQPSVEPSTEPSPQPSVEPSSEPVNP